MHTNKQYHRGAWYDVYACMHACMATEPPTGPEAPKLLRSTSRWHSHQNTLLDQSHAHANQSVHTCRNVHSLHGVCHACALRQPWSHHKLITSQTVTATLHVKTLQDLNLTLDTIISAGVGDDADVAQFEQLREGGQVCNRCITV
jgi:hypothetical protein